MSCNSFHRWALVLVVVLASGCASAPDSGDTRPGKQTSAVTPEVRSKFQEAVALMEADESDQARQILSQLHRTHPELSGPLVNLCILDYQAGQTDAAESCFERVLGLDPEHPEALTHLGVIARQAGEFGQAEDYYRQALTADPDHAPALRNLGILLDLYRGKPREALSLYQRYQALLPEPDPAVEQWVADLKNRL